MRTENQEPRAENRSAENKEQKTKNNQATDNGQRTTDNGQRTIKTWPLNWALIRYRPGPFAMHSIFQILFIAAPVGLGLVMQAVFDTITGAAPATLGVWALVALYISIGLAQLAVSFGSVWGDVTFRYGVGGLLRHNMFASLLRRPGALPPPISS